MSKVEAVVAAGLLFAFTDGHAAMDLSDFYDDLANLDQIDRPLMSATYWLDNEEFPDRKRRRQAEFLIYQCAPWEIMTGIAVKTEAMKERVKQILLESDSDHKFEVKVLPNWYY